MQLGKERFSREYLGIPGGSHTSLFTWELYERATQVHVPLMPPGAAFAPPPQPSEPRDNPFRALRTSGAFRSSYNAEDPKTWPGCKPYFIAHDVGRVRDRSTAVIGGNSPFGNRVLGILEAIELQQGLYGSARASELAAIDRRYYSNTMIIVDLSNDATYAEFLYETFGQRVIGVHISRYGDGMNPEHRPVRGGYLPVYTIGRTYLFDLLHSEFQSGLVRFSDNEMMRRTYEQLA